jgi:uncharacterized protein (TIGR02453 family)
MQDIFSFLGDLSRNNNRGWFTEHPHRYEEALEQFKTFVTALHEGLMSFDPSLGAIEPKNAIFRIYKDIRFSKDKTPYKTHFGCWMTKGGRKSTDAGYYFHMEPGGSFMAAGSYSPPSEQLNLIRQEIVFNPQAYLKIMDDPRLKSRFERHGQEDKLKKGPVGFPKDFEHLEEIKNKHFILSRSYTDAEVKKKDFITTLTGDYRSLYPLVEYLNHAMSFTGNE